MNTAASKQVDLVQKFIEHTRAEPVWFAKEVLNHKVLPGEPTIVEDPDRSWELDDFQVDLLEACADVWRKRMGIPTRVNHEGRNYITVRSGHGSGKTHTAGLIPMWFNTAFPGRVVCTAPKLLQLRTRIWGAMRKIEARAEPFWRSTHVIHDTSVNWLRPDAKGKMQEDKNWCILAETATKAENIAGHHERFQLIVVEEATGVSEQLWPAIFGATGQELTILLMISNPTKRTGTFAASHLKESEAKSYFRYHIKLANSRRMKRDYVEKLERKYGKNSPVVKVRALGEFAETDINQLVSIEWIAAARDKDVDPIRGDGSRGKLRVSVDCAGGGDNESVCTAMRHFESVRVGLKMTRHSFDLQDATVKTADAAELLFKQYGGDKNEDDFVVDSLGVGLGVAGVLRSRGYNVVFYQGGAASADSAKWRCRRVQSYMVLRNDLRDGSIALLENFVEESTDWDDLDGQLCSIKSRATDKLEDLVTKEQMVADGIASPDMADSLAMQYATQAPMAVTSAMGGEQAKIVDQIFIVESEAWSNFPR
jgi:hypothetical protein